MLAKHNNAEILVSKKQCKKFSNNGDTDYFGMGMWRMVCLIAYLIKNHGSPLYFSTLPRKGEGKKLADLKIKPIPSCEKTQAFDD